MKSTISPVRLCLYTSLVCFTSSIVANGHEEVPLSEDGSRGSAVAKFVMPETVIAGQSLTIRLKGVTPNQLVRVTAERVTKWRGTKLNRSSAVFLADASGAIDVTKQQPVADRDSSYRGIEPLGLLWSMTPVEEENTQSPVEGTVRFTAYAESQVDEGSELLTKFDLRIIAGAKDLIEFPLRVEEEPLEGAFVVMPPSEKPLPVIITLGGSEGGDSSARRTAPGLASQGYAVIGVPYYSPAYGDAKPQFSSLPRAFQEIPLDRLEAVVEAIDKDDRLDGNRIGLHGVSKGGEFVLAIASRLQRFRAVAAFVPSDVVWEGWGGTYKTSSFSYQGKPLPFVPYKGMDETIAKLSRGEAADIRVPHDNGRNAYPERIDAARIRVEDITAALMVVGGDKDKTWDSGGMCRKIVERRNEEGLKTEAWISEDAGHYLSGHAFNPMAYAPADASFRTKTYPAMLDFFKRTLQDN